MVSLIMNIEYWIKTDKKENETKQNKQKQNKTLP